MAKKDEARRAGQLSDRQQRNGQGVESERGNAQSHVSDNTISEYNAAMSYAERNPAIMSDFECYALDCAARGHRISAQHFFEGVRARDRVDSKGGDAHKVDNNWLPVFARLLVKRNPRFKKRITLRKSRFDPLIQDGGDSEAL